MVMMKDGRRGPRVACLLLLLSLYPATDTLMAEPVCDQYTQTREVFFGDLHVHTTLSFDARTQDTRNTPVDAYRFARGERVGIQPYDRDDNPLRYARIDRPLDFAAVTDHAEMLGEQRICESPGATGHYSIPCLLLRHLPRLSLFVVQGRASSGQHPRYDFCGEGGAYCLKQAKGPWREIQQAAHLAYRPCDFSTFVGYEWTGSSMENIHRNIIFRGTSVLELPISFIEHNNAKDMLTQLDRDCLGECEALSIPHNPNLSDGRMFPAYSPGAAGAMDRVEIDLRARYELLVEVLQHKGSSECWYEASPGADELCAFEQLPYSIFRGNLALYPKIIARSGLIESTPPVASAGYVRSVLVEGLKYRQTHPVNPYRLGFIGGTDTHLGTAGAVSEKTFKGHGGAGKSHRSVDKHPGLVDNIEYNPGGLTAVWAEENTREALFSALRRRETYATSGPRIRLRAFAGFGLSPDMCDAENMAELAYEGGVPMGGTLGAAQESTPLVLVEAIADSGTPQEPGVPLQRVQIIKGWVDDSGSSRTLVYDVAGDADNGAGVNEQDCSSYGTGSNRLCAVWRDPDFDPGARAYYYARAVENPSCRWSARACIAQGIDCAALEGVPESFEYCCTLDYPKAIQERAIASPIWYEP